MAILWSSFECISTPPSINLLLPIPFTTIVSLSSIVSTPDFCKPSHIAFILSVSLYRSSSTPSITVFPEALAAAIDRIGNSSIIDGTLDFGTLTPFKSLELEEISAINSPFISRLFNISIFAPISTRVSNNPIRNLLTQIFLTFILLFGVIIADTIGKAALEGSDGTFMFNGLSSGNPWTEIFHDLSCNWVVSTLAPRNFNIRSVWSLDKDGSITVVFPNEDNPDSKIQDFIWADDTGLW